jgi:hypothetical protein
MQQRHFKPTSVGVLLSSDDLWDLIEVLDAYVKERPRALDSDHARDLQRIKARLQEAERAFL